MKKQYLLLIALFITPSLFFAQDFKGLKTVDYTGQLFLNLGSSDYFKQTEYKGSFSQIRLVSPFYGKFISNKLLIGGQSFIDYQRNTQVGVTQPTQPYLDVKRTKFEFSLSPLIRYYLNEASKCRIYAQLQGEMKLTVDNYSSKSNSQDLNINRTEFDAEYVAGSLGINKAIDTYIYNEANISFVRFKGISNISLNYGLRNFMPSILSKKNEEGTPQYLAKGKSVYDPSARLEYEMQDFSDNSVKLSLNYLQARFLTDRIAIGGRAYLSTLLYTQNQNVNYENKTNVCLHLNPLARYYLPVTERFYVYPEIGLSLYYDNLSQNRLTTNYKTSVGFNYFMNKNVAYEFNFYWYSNNYVDNERNSAYFNSGITLGVTYFIDKVKL
jgi:hypothetical protein